MSDLHPPTITSFVIRFVVEETPAPLEYPPYRGSVRHVQSDEVLHFSVWQEAVEFIRRYVPLAAPKQE
jgi:hypothetical protein